MKSKRKLVVAGTILILVVSILTALMCGTYALSVNEVINTLLGNGSKLQNMAVLNIRLPRICMAIIVAEALATSGSILQTVTKNPLAEPGLIGINAGAAFFVVILISLKTTNYYSELGIDTILLMPLVAVIGAFAAAAFIYGLSYRKGSVSPTRLLLVGIGVNAGISALITVYQLQMAKGSYNEVFTWVNGSLWGSSFVYVKIMAPIVILLLFIVLYKARKMDVLDMGDEMATGLGLHVHKERRCLLIAAVALSAVATAVAGNIAFLGLLGPHIAKKMVGPKHRMQILMAILISSILLILADTASRNLFVPLEIPVGITLSIFGVPYFIYLMLKEK